MLYNLWHLLQYSTTCVRAIGAGGWGWKGLTKFTLQGCLFAFRHIPDGQEAPCRISLSKIDGFSSSCWVIIPYCMLKVNWSLGGTFHISLQGWIVRQVRNHHEACFSGFLFILLFSPEDGNNMVLQNITWLSVYYMALFLIRWNSSRSSQLYGM